MDTVRFGRVLGIGTRLAGKTLAQAVDAAAAPNPAATQPPVKSPPPVSVPSLGSRFEQKREHGRLLTRSVWRPFAKASGVLWLEVTGVFFGLIALFGLQGIWMYRGAAFHAVPHNSSHQHFLLSVLLAVLFGYFCVSSFLRAAQKARR